MAEVEVQGRAGWSRERTAWAALAGLVALHVVLAVLLFDPKPFIGGDNAGYMILAESLASGQGYRDIYLPGAPPHAQYPPLYPSVLAVVRGFGGGLIAFKMLSVVFTALSVAVAFLLARRRLGWPGALAMAAPFAVNPVLLYYSHWVLSEAPFVLLTLLALWVAERMEDSPRWLALSVAAALFAYLTRAAGLPMLVALLAALAWRREWRRLAAVGAAVLAVVGGWWYWGQVAASESARVYSRNLLLVDPYRPELGYVGPGGLLARTIENIRLYTIEVLPQSLAGPGPGGGLSLLAMLAGLLVVVLAAVAWVRGIRRGRPLELFVAFYAGLIFLWPAVWTDRRFLLPLLPVLLLLAAEGAVWCFEFLRARRPGWALPVIGALLVLMTVPDNVRSVGFSQRCMRYYRLGDSLACYPPAWRAFAEAAYWVRDNTEQDAVVINRKPRLFYYFSGRRGDVYPFTTDEAAMLDFLDRTGADYVVVARISATTYRYLVPVINGVPERFQVKHTVGDPSAPQAWVLAYVGAPEEARPGDTP
jgi:hypothetical protein